MEKVRDFSALPASDRQALERKCRYEARTWEAALRAMIILKSGLGDPVDAICQELGVCPRTVYKWRRRYLQAGLAGLENARRRMAVDTPMKQPRGRISGGARRRIPCP